MLSEVDAVEEHSESMVKMDLTHVREKESVGDWVCSCFGKQTLQEILLLTESTLCSMDIDRMEVNASLGSVVIQWEVMCTSQSMRNLD